MCDAFKNVDWAAYGRSKKNDLAESFRISRVHFAQCSISLSFDEYLKYEGIFLEKAKEDG